MTIPLVSWKDAPDWAVAHVFQPWGEGMWSDAKPYMGKHIHDRGRWWYGPTRSAIHQASGYELPLGTDWRETLEMRPQQTRPVRVCLCGSTRFSQAFQEANLRETLAGKIVLTIGCDLRSDDEIFKGMSSDELSATKEMLDTLHLRKIDLADEVLIINLGGYIGESTARELAYAREHGKIVRFLEKEPSVQHDEPAMAKEKEP